MAEFGTPETWNMKVGDFLEQKEFTIPQEKPQALLDLQEQNRKQRLLDSLQKIGPGLMDESLDFIRRENFDKGGSAEIRKYLKGLKKGSTVDIAKYLNKNNLTGNNRALASSNFKRILDEFTNKNFKVKFAAESYDQKVPLTKDQTKIAKEVYKEEIKKYDSFNDWQRDEKNKYKVSDIRQGKTTLETKATGIIKDDPNRIIAKAPRGSEKLTDVIFPDKKMPSGKTMEQEFLDDLREKFSKPRGQGLQNKDFVEKYPISNRQIQRVINYYIPKLKLKYPKGEKRAGDYKQRKERFGDVTDLTTEETIAKDIKKPILEERGMVKPRGTRPAVGVIDFAHRISKDHANALGIQFGTETTGFDSRLINQIIVKPSEIRLENFYKTQRDILDKIKSKGATDKLTKEMNDINKLINNEVKKTSGRLIGVNIDPETQEVSFTGQKKKFKLSNLNKTFKEIKEIPYEERIETLRKEVAKSVDAEIKRGFRPYDFREILGDPKNRQTLLKYAKENAPDIFSRFKEILNNPNSKRRFAIFSKLPGVVLPAGIIMGLANLSGEVEASEISPEQAGAAVQSISEEAEEGSLLGNIGAGAGLTTGAAIGSKATQADPLKGLRQFGKKGAVNLLKILGTPAGVAAYEAGLIPGLEGGVADRLKEGDSAEDVFLRSPTTYAGLPLATLGQEFLKTRPALQRILNLGLSPKLVRMGTPVGIGLMGLTALADSALKFQEEFDALSPEEQKQYLKEQEEFGEDVQGAAEGGRIGFADGPDDPSKRKFMKLMGILSLLPYGMGKLVKPAAKVAPVVAEGVKLGVDKLMMLVDKIKRLGKPADDLAIQERQKVTKYEGKDGSEYELVEDLTTGDIRVTRDKPGFAASGDDTYETIEDRSTFEIKKGQVDETTKGKKPPDEYDEGKAIADPDGTFSDFEEVDDSTIKAIEDEIN